VVTVLRLGSGGQIVVDARLPILRIVPKHLFESRLTRLMGFGGQAQKGGVDIRLGRGTIFIGMARDFDPSYPRVSETVTSIRACSGSDWETTTVDKDGWSPS
jgi:hypothetical protein